MACSPHKFSCDAARPQKRKARLSRSLCVSVIQFVVSRALRRVAIRLAPPSLAFGGFLFRAALHFLGFCLRFLGLLFRCLLGGLLLRCGTRSRRSRSSRRSAFRLLFANNQLVVFFEIILLEIHSILP